MSTKPIDSSYKKQFVQYTDVVSPVSLTILSSWKTSGKKSLSSASCQTSPELYEFNDMDSQTGVSSEVYQSEISSKKQAGIPLLDYLITTYGKLKIYSHLGSSTIFQNFILDGYVTIDEIVCKDPDHKIDLNNFVELTLSRGNMHTQTSEKMQQEESKELSGADEIGLGKFLNVSMPILITSLKLNKNSKAFDGYDISVSDSNEGIQHWSTLSVDLEKRKVLFPDWSKARYARGVIARCVTKSNKERIYDIDYDDGMKQQGVREEYIRILENKDKKLLPNSKLQQSKKLNVVKLYDGLRVHCKQQQRGDVMKYIPGRIVKASGKGNAGGFDCECEDDIVIRGITSDDVVVGVGDGEGVEARRPERASLECTGISWNASGSVLAVSYGRRDITGWCDLPGAIATWGIFNKQFQPSEPDQVLDHPSCLMCLSCHPENPSLIAAGSFNGEVIVWDLNKPETPLAVSSISDYTHKEPVMCLNWIFDKSSAAWLIVSTGADGRILQWNLINAFSFPVKGALLSTSKSSRRHYPIAHGATCTTFLSAAISKASSSSLSSSMQWVITGQEGGALIRTPLNNLFEAKTLTKDSFKSFPNIEDLYSALKRPGILFTHDSHVGAVNSIHSSNFNRNVFLSGGADGTLKLFHTQQKAPLRQWDPSPPSGTIGAVSTFSPPITSVQFSPHRSTVFAASSMDGFIYLFDLSVSSSEPTDVLEAFNSADNTIPNSASSANTGKSGGNINNKSKSKRVAVTGIAFNHKYKFIAACDISGCVHIWRLNWRLSNKQKIDDIVMNEFVNVLEFSSRSN